MNAIPEAVVIVAGDIDYIELMAVFSKFAKIINFPTRGNSMLDQVYWNILRVYKAVAAPHPDFSDCISVELIPATNL